MAKKTLQQLRDDIDHIDKTLHQLLNQRAVCAQEVAAVKLAENAVSMAKSSQEQAEQVRFYRPEREAQVLRRVKQRNNGPLSDQTVAYLFREIMSACLALEQPVKVAYLGPAGTFSHAATNKHFGYAVDAIAVDAIEQVFSEVVCREADYGVVPVENSTEGMVALTLDQFMTQEVKICGEVELPVEHNLLINKTADISKVETIAAHQQALSQCRHYLDKHWPSLKREALSSNAQAASLAQKDPTMLAIASHTAADLYQLDIVKRQIQDSQHNTTRFLIIGREQIASSGNDKTSIIVSVRNKPGALFVLLEVFEREQIMLTRIDTRPSKTEKWAYVFFIEFEGHIHDATIQKIMSDLAAKSISIKLLGSYPKAIL